MKSNNQLRANLKRTFGVKMRWLIQKNRLEHCGKSVFIDKNVHLMRYPKNISIKDEVVIKSDARICSCNNKAKIVIGERTTIGYHTFIFASENITIGDDCLIAPFVYIVDSDHGIEKNKRINVQGNITAPITIHNDVWIGTGAKILKGVTIGEGAVIASGALVKSDVKPYDIVGGIPAKKISERK